MIFFYFEKLKNFKVANWMNKEFVKLQKMLCCQQFPNHSEGFHQQLDNMSKSLFDKLICDPNITLRQAKLFVQHDVHNFQKLPTTLRANSELQREALSGGATLEFFGDIDLSITDPEVAKIAITQAAQREILRDIMYGPIELFSKPAVVTHCLEVCPLAFMYLPEAVRSDKVWIDKFVAKDSGLKRHSLKPIPEAIEELQMTAKNLIREVVSLKRQRDEQIQEKESLKRRLMDCEAITKEHSEVIRGLPGGKKSIRIAGPMHRAGGKVMSLMKLVGLY